MSTEQVAHGKPAPDIYLAVTAELGCPPPDCAAVEDSSNGLRSAGAAGLRVIAVPQPQYPPDPDALAQASLILPSLAGLTAERGCSAGRELRPSPRRCWSTTPRRARGPCGRPRGHRPIHCRVRSGRVRDAAGPVRARPRVFWALVALIVFGIVLIFVHIPHGELIYSVLGLVIFAGLTMFDFQRLRRSSDLDSAPLIAANIFLDALNVFLFFLRIFSGGRD